MSFRENAARIKAEYNIVDYIQQQGVELKVSGTGQYKGKCPFHNDNSPSMTVDLNYQSYRCWACGAHGDIIDFAVNREGYEPGEALKKLADDKGINLEVDDTVSTVDYTSLRKAVRDAANYYHEQLSKQPRESLAWDELRKRRLRRGGETGMVYGYSPAGSSLKRHLLSLGYSEEIMLQAGLLRQAEDGSTYDFFRQRLMFYFVDRQGHPIGFSARKLNEQDQGGKFINSPETPLFKKSRVLYNHNVARQAVMDTQKDAKHPKAIYVCEGQFDVAALYAIGRKNAVAASGTSFTKEHALEAQRLAQGGKVVFCFDGDEAGEKAAEKVFLSHPFLHEDAQVVMFPGGMDPCDVRLERGDEALAELLDHPVGMVDFMLNRQLKKHGDVIRDATEKSRFISAGARIVKTIANPTLRSTYEQMLALMAVSTVDVVSEAVSKADPLTKETTVEAEEVVLPEELLPLDELCDASDYFETASHLMRLSIARKSQWCVPNDLIEKLPGEYHALARELAAIKAEGKRYLYPEMFEGQALDAFEFLGSGRFKGMTHLLEGDEFVEHYCYVRDHLSALMSTTEAEARIDQAISALGDEAGPRELALIIERLGLWDEASSVTEESTT